jgi:hypothetical protein
MFELSEQLFEMLDRIVKTAEVVVVEEFESVGSLVRDHSLDLLQLMFDLCQQLFEMLDRILNSAEVVGFQDFESVGSLVREESIPTVDRF